MCKQTNKKNAKIASTQIFIYCIHTGEVKCFKLDLSVLFIILLIISTRSPVIVILTLY